MHSRIFQVDRGPIQRDEWPNEDAVVENSRSSLIDYAFTLKDDEERKRNIANLANLIGGMFALNIDGISMTYKGGMEEWRKSYVAHIITTAESLNSENVFNSLQLFNLQKAIKHPLPYNLFILGDDEFAIDSVEFMEWVDRRFKVGDILYIGAVLDYHF